MSEQRPTWVQPFADLVNSVSGDQLSRHLPPEGGGRASAVLILLGEGPLGPDLLLTQRSATLSSHAGQPAFPGGAVDDADADVIDAALREAEEETGLDRAGVEVLGLLPDLYLPPSGFIVSPVLAWWRSPSPVHAVNLAEVESVHRVPLRDLVDPANRGRARHPRGYVGPAFSVEGMLVWGFTAGLIDRLLDLTGLAEPWDVDRYFDLREVGS